MKIKPARGRVILRLPRDERKDEITESGILIPKATKSDAESRKDYAEVYAVGEGKILSNGIVLPMEYEPGQWVLFNKYAGMQVIDANDPDHKYLIIRDTDIEAVIE